MHYLIVLPAEGSGALRLVSRLWVVAPSPWMELWPRR
jgi:hypothetical protein